MLTEHLLFNYGGPVKNINKNLISIYSACQYMILSMFYIIKGYIRNNTKVTF